jgi:DNA-binding transcriptional LysR family regulator
LQKRLGVQPSGNAAQKNDGRERKYKKASVWRENIKKQPACGGVFKMKFYQLQYFQEAYRRGSISKAAEALFVSQPAVSFAVKELEDEFGVKLFERTGNKIENTEAGRLFYERVTRMLGDAAALSKEMRNLSNGRVLLRIATPPMIGCILFPRVYDELKKALPKMKIEILEYGSLQSQNLVIKGDADVAVAILDNLDGGAVNEEIETHVLFGTELVFCVKKGHRLAGHKTISWEELEGQELILMREDSYQNSLIKRRFAEKNIRLDVLLFSSQFITIRNFIVRGDAGAFLFKQVADADDEIVPIKLSEPVKLNIGVMWRKNSKKQNEIHDFIAQMKEFVKRL